MNRTSDRNEIVAQFKAGASKQSLYREYGCSRHAVDRILIEAGAMTYDHPRSDEIMALRRKGKTRDEIVEKLGINKVVVGKVLRSAKKNAPEGSGDRS